MSAKTPCSSTQTTNSLYLNRTNNLENAPSVTTTTTTTTAVATGVFQQCDISQGPLADRLRSLIEADLLTGPSAQENFDLLFDSNHLRQMEPLLRAVDRLPNPLTQNAFENFMSAVCEERWRPEAPAVRAAADHFRCLTDRFAGARR